MFVHKFLKNKSRFFREKAHTYIGIYWNCSSFNNWNTKAISIILLIFNAAWSGKYVKKNYNNNNKKVQLLYFYATLVINLSYLVFYMYYFDKIREYNQ